MGSRELFSGTFDAPRELTLPTAAQLGPDKLEATYAAMRAGQDESVAALLDGWQALEIMQCQEDHELASTATMHLEKATDLTRSAGNVRSETYRLARLGLAYLPVFGNVQTGKQYAWQQRNVRQKLGALTHETLDAPEDQIDYEALARLVVYATMLRFGAEETVYAASPREAHLPGGGRYCHNSYTILPNGKKLPIDVQLLHPPRSAVGERLSVARALEEARLQGSPLRGEAVSDERLQADLRWAVSLSLQEAGGPVTSPLTPKEIALELNGLGHSIRHQIVGSYLRG